MSQQQPGALAAAKDTGSTGKREVKILMLHGYTQSGSLFRSKTRALEKLLVKTLAPFALQPTLLYPTGPNRLRASDIPGYEPPPSADDARDGGGGGSTDADLPDTWAWFRKDEATGTYRLLDAGMAALASAVRDAGGIDAVCGFSQGACMASLVAAALEPDRPLPASGADWALSLRDANYGRALRFAVLYSGFYAPVDGLAWCYGPGKIRTPTLHYLGSMDAVVDESRSRGLVDRCLDPGVVVHPGGHHVPISKECVMPLVVFIKDHVGPDEPRAGL